MWRFGAFCFVFISQPILNSEPRKF
jgi:hypothetical protein